jgi:hypothetical protein
MYPRERAEGEREEEREEELLLFSPISLRKLRQSTSRDGHLDERVKSESPFLDLKVTLPLPLLLPFPLATDTVLLQVLCGLALREASTRTDRLGFPASESRGNTSLIPSPFSSCGEIDSSNDPPSVPAKVKSTAALELAASLLRTSNTTLHSLSSAEEGESGTVSNCPLCFDSKGGR